MMENSLAFDSQMYWSSLLCLEVTTTVSATAMGGGEGGRNINFRDKILWDKNFVYESKEQGAKISGYTVRFDCTREQ